MARRRMDYFRGQGPKRREAQEFVKKVFALMERLHISYQQMANESGLTKLQLYSCRTRWASKSKVKYEYMFISIANKLVDFWNKHLIDRNAIRNVTPQSAQTPDVSRQLLILLLQKVGIYKARELLAERNKAEILDQYIVDLSPEELADLI